MPTKEKVEEKGEDLKLVIKGKDEKIMELEKKLAEEIAKAPKIEVKSPEAKVFNKRGGYVRTYSKELHGKDFAKMAKKFADREKGYIK